MHSNRGEEERNKGEQYFSLLEEDEIMVLLENIQFRIREC